MWSDFRLAARSAFKHRLFSGFIVALLALGIAANTTLFSLADALLLRPLAVREADRLVRLVVLRPPLQPASQFFFQEYEAWASSAKSFEDLIAWSEMDMFVRTGSVNERLRVNLVTDNFYSALGVQPALGRLPDSPGAGSLPAVLSYGYWQRRFNGDTRVIGSTVIVEGQSFEIAGVTPKGFNGLAVETSPELRVPISAAKLWPNRLWEGKLECAVAGHLRLGVTIAQARDEASAIRLAHAPALYGSELGGLGQFGVESASRGVSRMRSQFSGALWLSVGGLWLLQLMVSANVAGLLLARAAAKQGELAVRRALGASSWAILRQQLAEASVLTAAAATVAIPLSATLIPALTSMLPPVRDLTGNRLALTLDIRLDWRVLAYSVALSCLTALCSGSIPALISARRKLNPALKEHRAGGRGSGEALLVAQVALCSVLLFGAGLMVLTLRNLEEQDQGFTRDRVVTLAVEPDMAGYKSQEGDALRKRLMEAARGLPGTQAVAAASRGLMRGTGIKSTMARAGESAGPREFLNTSINAVSPEYFETMGIPLIAGRLFPDVDAASKGAGGRVVNRAFARKFFPDRDPIGQKFGGVPNHNDPAKPTMEVIGVVGDAKYRSPREPFQPIIYGPLAARLGFILHIRSQAPEETVIREMRVALSRIDGRLSFVEETTLAGEVASALWPERVAASLATAFAAAAAIIVAAGLFAVLAFAVTQRRREIGIRMALGALPAGVAWMIVRRGAILAGCGWVVGIGVALALAPRIRPLLYEVDASDPRPVLGAVACVAVVSLAAALVPSLRASRMSPAEVLRSD